MTYTYRTAGKYKVVVTAYNKVGSQQIKADVSVQEVIQGSLCNLDCAIYNLSE